MVPCVSGRHIDWGSPSFVLGTSCLLTLGSHIWSPFVFIGTCFAVCIKLTKLVLVHLTTLITYLFIKPLVVSWCSETTPVCLSRIRWAYNCHWLINLGKRDDSCELRDFSYKIFKFSHRASMEKLSQENIHSWGVTQNSQCDLIWERGQRTGSNIYSYTFY